jgi:hypothetical protein
MDMASPTVMNQLSQVERHFIKVNHPPDPQEEARIRSNLAANRQKVASKDLPEEEKTLLFETIVSQEAILSPVRRVPIEIISEIIQGVVAGGNSIELSSEPNSGFTSSLWCCIKVCHLWREAALSTPSLWSFINIRTHIDIRERVLQVLEVLLERSHSYPLNLGLFLWSNNPDMSHDQLKKLMEVLTVHRYRWHTLSLSLSLSLTREFMAALTTFLQGPTMLSLYSFRLHYYNYYDPSGPLANSDLMMPVMKCLAGALNLRRVSISPVKPNAESFHLLLSLPLPWNWFESFAMSFDGIARASRELILALLKKTPNLLEFRAYHGGSALGSEGGNIVQVPLIKLKKLLIAATGTHIISSLHLPNLEEVQLLMHSYPVENVLKSCSALLARSSPPLQAVTLLGVEEEKLEPEGSVERYSRFWESLPSSVTTLRVGGDENEDENKDEDKDEDEDEDEVSMYNKNIFSSIEKTKDLKKLEHLYIEVSLGSDRNVTQTLADLLAMVKSLSSLRTFNLKVTILKSTGSVGALPTERDLSPFYDLRKGGMAVEMAFEGKWDISYDSDYW